MIDEFVEQISRRLRVSARRRARIVQDIRDHLDDAVDRLMLQGADRRTAEEEAVNAFGPPPDLARLFNADAAATVIRRTPMIMAACGVAVVGGFLLAAIMQPHVAVPAAATTFQQVAFFAAVLGLQFAFVAGLRVLARVGACWRTAPCAADLVLVRRSGAVFLGGLAVATGGWMLALAGAIGRQPDARPVPFVVGIALMLTATIGAGVAMVHRHGTPEGETSPVRAGSAEGSVHGIAERVIQQSSRRPLTVCAGVAVLAALSAMSHAETTVAGALPWGGIEAAAVIAGFVLLGPMLELRSRGSRHA
jgi:hypothetical protein